MHERANLVRSSDMDNYQKDVFMQSQEKRLKDVSQANQTNEVTVKRVNNDIPNLSHIEEINFGFHRPTDLNHIDEVAEEYSPELAKGGLNQDIDDDDEPPKPRQFVTSYREARDQAKWNKVNNAL